MMKKSLLSPIYRFTGGLSRGLATAVNSSSTGPNIPSDVAGSTVASIRNTVKPLDSRKTYLIDTYTRIIRDTPVFLVVHHNNLLKDQDNHYRALIDKAGGSLIVTRSRLFQTALNRKSHQDPASREALKEYQAKVRHAKKDHVPYADPLSKLFSGPSAIITFPDIDPKKVASTISVLDRSQDRLILLGASVEGKAYEVKDVNVFKNLPDLATLRAELAGVLSILGGAGLVQTLENASRSLYVTMEGRRKQLEED